MTIYVFGVRDSAVDAFITPPLFLRGKGEAIRMFTDACNDPKHDFNRHARDYELFYLGEFDDRTGALMRIAAPESVIRASECVNAEIIIPPDRDRS